MNKTNMETKKGKRDTLEGGVVSGMAEKDKWEGEKKKKGHGNGGWGGHDR